MSTLRSRRGAASLAVTAACALLLGGCVIGDVDQDGDQDQDGPATGSAAPAPTTGTEDPADPADTEDAETPETFEQGDLAIDESAGSAGVALLDGGAVRTGGSMADMSDAAWSTSKVPLAIAALNAAGGGLEEQMRQAISASDNDAAEALWASLGSPSEAAQAVQDVLADGGDTGTEVPAEKRREEFSTFGQTYWTLEAQATFASNLRCLPGTDPVVEAMGQVVAGQDYGLGQIDGAVYKGGWGPGDDGTYLIRQFGLVPAQDGTMVPVAVAAEAPDGSY